MIEFCPRLGNHVLDSLLHSIRQLNELQIDMIVFVISARKMVGGPTLI